MSVHADGSDAGHGNVWYHGKPIPASEYNKIKGLTKDEQKEHH